MEQNPRPVNWIQPEDVAPAFLSDIVYSAADTSRVPGANSDERLNRALSDPHVRRFIGDDWKVFRSTQDAALFVNYESQEAYLAVRGTSDLMRDFALEDICGFLGLRDQRALAIKSQFGGYIEFFAETLRFKVTVTGHSLGGSLASAIASLLRLQVVTFNAPELSHMRNDYAAGRQLLSETNMARHYRLSSDIVARLTSGGERFFSERNGQVIPFDGNAIEAHRMGRFLGVITSGLYDGYDSRTFDNNCSTSDLRQIESAPRLGLTLHDPEGLAANGTINVETATASHPDFDLESQEIRVRDSNGVEILLERIASIQLRGNAIDASHTATAELLRGGFTLLLTGSASGPQLIRLVRDSATAGGLRFVELAAGDLLQLGSEERAIGHVGVQVAYNILQGHHEQASRIAFEEIANRILNNVLDIPFAYGKTNLVANGQLFGSGVISQQTERDRIALPIFPFITFGANFDRSTILYRDGEGREVLRNEHSVGVGLSVGVANAGIGRHNGFESSSTVSTTNSEGLRTTTWWNRNFKNEFRLTIHIGNLIGSWKIFPGKSVKREFILRENEDGGDLQTIRGLSNQLCAFPATPSPLADINGPAHRSTNNRARVLLSENGSSVHETLSSVSPEVLSSHDRAARIIESLVPENGRTDHLVKTTEEHIREKKVYSKPKHTIKFHNDYTFEEHETAWNAGVTLDDNGQAKEIFSEAQTNSVLGTMHKVNGGTTAQDVQQLANSVRRVFSKTNGESYDSYNTASTLSDGSSISVNEEDLHRLTESEVRKDAHGNLLQSNDEESMIGARNAVTEAPLIATRTLASLSKIKVITHNIEEFIDQISKTTTNAQGEVIDRQEFNRGDHRSAQGVQTTTTSTATTTVVRRALVERTSTTERETRTYQTHEGTTTYSENSTNTRSVAVERPREGIQGFFVNERTRTDTASDGTENTSNLGTSFNPAADRAIGAGITGSLDTALELYARYKAGELGWKPVVGSFAKLLVDIGEGYGIGFVGDLAKATEELGDAIPHAALIIAGAHWLRSGINYWCPDEKKKISTMATATIDSAASIARAALQMILVGYEVGSPYLFASGQICTAMQIVARTLHNDGFKLESINKSVKLVWPQVVATASATWASYAILATLPKLVVPTLLTSLTSIAVPAVGFWVVSKVVQKGCEAWQASQEKKRETRKLYAEYLALLEKYDLQENTTLEDIERRARKVKAQVHPDRHPEDATFKAIADDFVKLGALHVKFQAEAEESNQEKLRALAQAFVDLLRALRELFGRNSVPELEFDR